MRLALAVLVAGCNVSHVPGVDAGGPMPEAGCSVVVREEPVMVTPLPNTCDGPGVAGFSIRVPGCPAIDVRPAFADETDGSAGRASPDPEQIRAGCLGILWDDCPSGCACEPDASQVLCVVAHRYCDELQVTVQSEYDANGAANDHRLGYVLTIDGVDREPLLQEGSGEFGDYGGYRCAR